ncbi:MAG: DUF4304 domain-containing protein [Dysgonomonas sp.]|nr:DUF4304 domain-containing protein [Dysgonomonas sp.]
MAYTFDENTPPKDIVIAACQEITDSLDGYRFLKSKREIVKKVGEFLFTIYFQSNRYNEKGISTDIWVNCSIENMTFDECYYGHNLGTISHNNFTVWKLYGKDNYESSVDDIKRRLQNYFLPMTERFINDIDNLVTDVVDKGFYPDNETTGYVISPHFILRYGNLDLLTKAIQKDYDLSYPQAKKNFCKSVEALRKGEEPDSLYSFKSLAEAVVEYDLKIIY